ncbi:Iron hydrogenase 1 [Pelotomaculum sp. FP]|uniref:[Fe-Fe] hydrogenase large subunit C-terminal domain-containing protein n=1 Tax=Pelotomaculum sp. FP TaxID=261474 RepID=UPI00106548DC|nr:[Fe-Fe] hydrogenase large subunit C-terminal domain-containing protein [Pelotomaculum sp. FP]TEB14027.1 Iron hydrogenase 1 [Pelotomaculum sp. FP]
MNLIKTNDAKCRDCYKCVRHCPVKAISIKSNQDESQVHVKVLDESCIHDGLCTSICPQKAKVVVSLLEKVKELLNSESGMVVASVAPSFPSAIPLDDPGLFPSLLRRLGFSYVGQTAVGAELIALEHRRLNAPGPVISSACPVVVNLVEQYYPHLIPYLSPLVSPMVAHGRYLKTRFPGCTVVFIGPCIAKIGEAMSEEVRDAVDYVLGFNEVWDWIKEENVDLKEIPKAGFDGYTPGPARLFPVEGGQLLASYMSTDIIDRGVQAVSGLDNCTTLFKNFTPATIEQRPGFTELLACSGGCLGGPCAASADDIYLKRIKLMDYYSYNVQWEQPLNQRMEKLSMPADLLYRKYRDRKVNLPVPDEGQIKDILAMSDKFEPGDELNCGACGFDTCREKAIAVYQGKAEPQMCIPFMRKRAESLSNMVLHALSDGVIIVGEDLTIQEINPAAEKIFDCASSVIGQKLDKLIDPSEFIRVFKEMTIVKSSICYLSNKMVTRQIIFPLGNRAVGIFTDITAELRKQKELQLVKTQTIQRAREVIKKQMTVAQVIAGLLGETTAETKVQLNQLINLMKEDGVEEKERKE